MDFSKYFLEDIPALVNRLEVDTSPEWGSMNASQMLDHLREGLAMSMEDVPRSIVIPEEKLPAYRKFLMGERPFVRDQPKPREFDKYTPLPVEFNQKQVQLLREINEMLDFFDENPNFSSIHPIFGRLNPEEWKQLHQKHFSHHFRQFGLE